MPQVGFKASLTTKDQKKISDAVNKATEKMRTKPGVAGVEVKEVKSADAKATVGAGYRAEIKGVVRLTSADVTSALYAGREAFDTFDLQEMLYLFTTDSGKTDIYCRKCRIKIGEVDAVRPTALGKEDEITREVHRIKARHFAATHPELNADEVI